jgi:hypothetical protein
MQLGLQQSGLSSYSQSDSTSLGQNQFNRLPYMQNQQTQLISGQQLVSNNPYSQATVVGLSQPSVSMATALGQQQLYQQSQGHQLTYQEQQQASLLGLQRRTIGGIFDGQQQMVPLSQAQQAQLASSYDSQSVRSGASLQGMPVTLIQQPQSNNQQTAHILLTSCQHLTPQQQQMYQQQMQLQHQAQHLKKIRRSLPHSSTDQTQAVLQQQQMRQKGVSSLIND